MKSKQIELKDFIKKNRRKVRLENLNAKQGFTFEDDKLLAIRKKIEAAGEPLGEIEGVEIITGHGTGLDKAFILDEADISNIKTKYNDDIILEYARGRDIRAYREIDFSKYVILIPRGWTRKTYGEDIQRAEHDIRDIIRHIRIKSGKDYNKDRKSRQGDYPWESGRSSIEKFKTNKIIWADMSGVGTALYDTSGCVIDSNSFCIPNADNLKYIVAIMNSRIFSGLVNIVSSTLGYGVARWKKQYVSNIVVPYMNNEIKEKLGNYVEKIQQLKKEGKPTDHLEAEVEKIVQELYGLTDEEVEYLCRYVGI